MSERLERELQQLKEQLKEQVSQAQRPGIEFVEAFKVFAEMQMNLIDTFKKALEIIMYTIQKPREKYESSCP
jgi:hypothetical protein